MLIEVMSDFIRKPLSRYRLAEALNRACPEFVAWCDDPENHLSRKEVIDQFEETWLEQLHRPLPINRVQESLSTVFRLRFALRPLDSPVPCAAVRLRVSCRGEGQKTCTVSAAIADSGANQFAIFYRNTLSAELGQGRD